MTKINIGDKVKIGDWVIAIDGLEYGGDPYLGKITEIDDDTITLRDNVIKMFGYTDSACIKIDESAIFKVTDCLLHGEKQEIPETHSDEEAKEEKNMVDHPAHYNVLGRKECIEEMIEKYGPLAVYNFCMCNAYKYSYRAGYKDDKEQDLKKAEWYIKKGVELLPLAQQENGDVPRAEIQKIADYCSFEDQIEKLKEEVGELRCAIDNFQADDKADS